MGHYCTGPDDLALPESIDLSLIDIEVTLRLRQVMTERDMSPTEASEFLKQETRAILRSEVRDYKHESKVFDEGFMARRARRKRGSNPYLGKSYLEPSWDLGWEISDWTERKK